MHGTALNFSGIGQGVSQWRALPTAEVIEETRGALCFLGKETGCKRERLEGDLTELDTSRGKGETAVLVELPAQCRAHKT